MTAPKVNTKEDTRFRVLRLLEENPDLTQREIADKLGISLGGVNYCLRALVDKRLVKIQNFQENENKFGYAYFLTPNGIYEKYVLAASFLKRKMDEYEALKEEIEALEKEVKKTLNYWMIYPYELKSSLSDDRCFFRCCF